MATFRRGSTLGLATAAALLAGLLALPAGAEEVYRWVDAEGTVHFSDRPPATANEKVTTMSVASAPPSGYDPDEDRYNVSATAERTQAVRDQRSQRSQAAQNQAPPTTVVHDAQPQDYGVNYYGYPPRYDGPGVRPPRPTQPPAERPEQLPSDTLRPPARSGRRN